VVVILVDSLRAAKSDEQAGRRHYIQIGKSVTYMLLFWPLRNAAQIARLR